MASSGGNLSASASSSSSSSPRSLSSVVQVDDRKVQSASLLSNLRDDLLSLPQAEADVIVFKKQLMERMKTSVPMMINNDDLDKIISAMMGKMDSLSFDRVFFPLNNLIQAVQSFPALKKLSNRASDKVTFIFNLFDQFLQLAHQWNKLTDMNVLYQSWVEKHLRFLIQSLLITSLHPSSVKSLKKLDCMTGTCDHQDGSVVLAAAAAGTTSTSAPSSSTSSSATTGAAASKPLKKPFFCCFSDASAP